MDHDDTGEQDCDNTDYDEGIAAMRGILTCLAIESGIILAGLVVWLVLR